MGDYMKQLLHLFQYIFIFSLSFIGYLCLPDLIHMWQKQCVFRLITDKQIVSSDSTVPHLYSLDNTIQVWDKANYNTGDLVCVKK
jgi:hypothetical protein